MAKPLGLLGSSSCHADLYFCTLVMFSSVMSHASRLKEHKREKAGAVSSEPRRNVQFIVEKAKILDAVICKGLILVQIEISYRRIHATQAI